VKYIYRTMALTMSVLILSACSPGTDFWGNPVPSKTPTVESTCAQPEAPPPSDPHLDKPADTPPGNNWVTYGLSVFALDLDGDRNYCIPIEVSYTKSVTDLDLVVDNRRNLPATVMHVTTTPWQEFVSFDYDPTLERFQGNPPTYKIELTAGYLATSDPFERKTHLGLVCRITILGAPAVQDIASPPSQFVCKVQVTNNFFNLA
jgi:hypothetical protein